MFGRNMRSKGRTSDEVQSRARRTRKNKGKPIGESRSAMSRLMCKGNVDGWGSKILIDKLVKHCSERQYHYQ